MVPRAIPAIAPITCAVLDCLGSAGNSGGFGSFGIGGNGVTPSDLLAIRPRGAIIDCAQVGRAPRFVRERTHLVDEVWFVTHQAEQRRSRAQRARRDRVVHVLHADGPNTGCRREPRGE